MPRIGPSETGDWPGGSRDAGENLPRSALGPPGGGAVGNARGKSRKIRLLRCVSGRHERHGGVLLFIQFICDHAHTVVITPIGASTRESENTLFTRL